MSRRSTRWSADFANTLWNNPKLDARLAAANGARWERAQSQTDRQKISSPSIPARLCWIGEVMSSVRPFTQRVAIRRTEEGSWIAIALITLLGTAIIACAALALYSTYMLHSTYIIRWQTMC
jgi:hypothetical protein